VITNPVIVALVWVGVLAITILGLWFAMSMEPEEEEESDDQ
jgi:hypothetical protein